MGRCLSLRLGLAFLMVTILLIAETTVWSMGNIGPTFEREVHDGISYASDPSKLVSLEQLLKNPDALNFAIHTSKAPNFGFSSHAFWFKFNIPKQALAVKDTLVLAFGYALIDDIRLYIPMADGSYQEKVVGRQYAFHERELATKDLHFLLQLDEQNADRPYYIRAESSSSNQYPLNLISLKKYLSQQNEKSLASHLYMGAMAILLFYNAIFFFVTLDRLYLIYIGFICASCAQVLSVQGLSYQFFWPHLSYFNKVSIPVLMNLSVALSVLFSVHSLARMTEFPKQLKLLKALGSLGALFALASFVIPYPISIKVSTLLTLLISFVLLIAYLRLSKVRYRPAYFFFISIGALLGAAIIYSLKAFGIVPHNAFTENSPLIGSALQMSLLTFALADRFRELKAEHAKVQDRMIALQKDNIHQLDIKVTEKAANIRSILQTINQGIFTISGTPPVIDQERSRALVRMFPAIQGQDVDPFTSIWQNTSLSADQIDQVKATLGACLDDDLINFEANVSRLPTKFHLLTHEGRKHCFEVDWSPILDEHERVRKILVAIRDSTLVRELEEVATQKGKEMDLMIQILAIPSERFARFVKSLRDLLQSIDQLLMIHGAVTKESLLSIYGFLHTIKGNARTYGITRLSDHAHELEDLVKSLLNDNDPLVLVQLHKGLLALDRLITTIEDVATRKLGRGLSRRALAVGAENFEHMLDVLVKIIHLPLQHELNQEVAKIRLEMLRIGFDSLDDALQDTFRSLKHLAEHTHKESPIIDFRDSAEVYLKDEVQDHIIAIFTHLLTNSLDHGIQPPAIRQKENKPPKGLISIHIQKHRLDELVILISDDGSGLNLPKLHETAVSKGYLTREEQDPHKIAEAIFYPGISTADHITQISGRGIGMDTVKSIIEKLEGLMTIEFRSPQPSIHLRAPFYFRIVLPARYFILGKLET